MDHSLKTLCLPVGWCILEQCGEQCRIHKVTRGGFRSKCCYAGGYQHYLPNALVKETSYDSIVFVSEESIRPDHRTPDVPVREITHRNGYAIILLLYKGKAELTIETRSPA